MHVHISRDTHIQNGYMFTWKDTLLKLRSLLIQIVNILRTAGPTIVFATTEMEVRMWSSNQSQSSLKRGLQATVQAPKEPEASLGYTSSVFFFLFHFSFLYLTLRQVSLSSPDWLSWIVINSPCLKLKDLSASALQVLGWKMCATMPGFQLSVCMFAEAEDGPGFSLWVTDFDVQMQISYNSL